MASNNIARLGVVLGIDTAAFTADVDKAISENKKLSAAIKRDSNAAAGALADLINATNDYGKTLTRVQLMERELASGRFMNASPLLKQQLLDQAKAYEAIATAQKKVTTGMTEQQRMGLMYQTTDLFTQIASGSNPLIAFIQQGGQFKDQMGGFANAFKALSEVITPFRIAMTSLGAVFAYAGYESYKANSELNEFQKQMALTGNFAGITASEFSKMGQSIADSTKIGISSAKEVMMDLVATGQYSEQSIASLATAIARFSRMSGMDVKDATSKLVSAFDGTANSALNLSKQYHFLTLEQYQHIEALEKAGKKQEAIAYGTDLFNEKLRNHEKALSPIQKMYQMLSESMDKIGNFFKTTLGPRNDESYIKALYAQLKGIESRGVDINGGPNAQKEYEQKRLEVLNRIAEAEAKYTYEKVALVAKSAKEIKDLQEAEDYKAAGGLEKKKQIEADTQKAINAAKYEEALASANEIEKIELEAQKQIADKKAEYAKKSEEEKRAFGGMLANQQAKEILAIEATKNEKIRQIRSKDKIELHKGMEEERIAREAIGAEEMRQAAANDIAYKAQTHTLEQQKEMLILKSNLIAVTEKDAKLAEIALKYEQKRKDIRYMPGEESMLQQLNQQEAIEKFNVAIEDSTKKTKEMVDSVWSNMSSAIDNFVKTGKLSFSDLARSIIQDLIAIQMKAQATGLFNMLVNSVIGGGGMGPSQTAPALDSSFNQYLANPKAAGGPVSGGSPYLIGEKGPELFVPSGSGTIIPNNGLSSMGSTTNVTNYNINAIDTKSFEDRLLGSSMAVWAANQYAGKSMPTNYGRT